MTGLDTGCFIRDWSWQSVGGGSRASMYAQLYCSTLVAPVRLFRPRFRELRSAFRKPFGPILAAFPKLTLLSPCVSIHAASATESLACQD